MVILIDLLRKELKNYKEIINTESYGHACESQQRTHCRRYHCHLGQENKENNHNLSIPRCS